MLTKLMRAMRAMRVARRNDDGVAMAAAIGVMAVGLILTTLVLTSIMSGYTVTSVNKAGVQSQASAEAGVAAARVGLASNSCTTGTYSSATGQTPAYSAQVWYRPSSAAAWVQGCPPSSSDTIKIVSGGNAQTLGLKSGGDRTGVEAVYSSPVTPSVTPSSGKAIYSYGSTTVTGSGHVGTIAGVTADVFVKNGSVDCTGGAGIDGNLVVANGNVKISGSCKVTGYVFASGTATLDGGGAQQVGGNVVASSVNITNSGSIDGSVWATGTGGVTSSNTARIAGSVYSAGPVTFTNRGQTVVQNVIAAGVVNLEVKVSGSVVSTGSNVNNNNAEVAGSVWATNGTYTATGGSRDALTDVVAKNATLGDGKVGGQVYISQNLALNKNYSAAALKGKALTKSGSSAPGVTTGWNGAGAPSAPTAVTAPVPPSVPTWVDYTYKTSDWADYVPVELPAGECKSKEFWTALQAIGTNKGIIDARKCTSTLDIGSGFGSGAPDYIWYGPDFTFKNDIMILTKKFAMTNGSLLANSPVKVWFVQEDSIANGTPDCNGQSFEFGGGGMTISTNVKMMMYTPCQVKLTSHQQIYGQIYSGGTATVEGAGAITFSAIGLPGADLDGGTVATPTPASRTWTIESIRNVDAP